MKENLITVVFIILLGIADVLLFTYVTNINRYKQLSRTRLEDNDVVRNMDLDKKKYDDVINTALKGEGIDINIKDKTENTNVKIHTIDESSLNHVRKKLVKYVKNELIQEIVKNNYIICGDTHQNFAIPIFNDGFLMLSMRRWAEVMNQAYGNQHNFYMAAVCDIQEKLPNE